MKLEVHLGVYNTDIIQRHSHIFEYIILFLFLSTTTILSEIICKIVNQQLRYTPPLHLGFCKKRVKYPLCNENRENLPKMCAHNFQKKKCAKRRILFAKCVLFYTMGAFSKLKGVFSQCPLQVLTLGLLRISINIYHYIPSTFYLGVHSYNLLTLKIYTINLPH